MEWKMDNGRRYDIVSLMEQVVSSFHDVTCSTLSCRVQPNRPLVSRISFLQTGNRDSSEKRGRIEIPSTKPQAVIVRLPFSVSKTIKYSRVTRTIRARVGASFVGFLSFISVTFLVLFPIGERQTV